MNINVSFYKTNGIEVGYRKAVEKYQDQSAEILGQIRAELSTSRRLVSPLMQESLSQLYFETLLSIDANLENLIQKAEEAKENEWYQQHDSSFNNAQKQIDDILTELAIEFNLAASAAIE